MKTATIFLNRRFVFLSLILLMAALALVGPAPAARADATIIVNSTDDSATPGDSACTLREAIMNAKAVGDLSAGDCAAGDGADTIIFSVSGSIFLDSTLPDINDTLHAPLTIDGGEQIALDGQNRVRVLYVSPDNTLNLSGITITRGYREGDINNPEAGGAGIWNRGHVTVTNSTFSFNSGNFGGAIENDANNLDSVTLHISNSTFYSNSAINGYGGAIYVRGGDVVVANSTFSGNLSSFLGGGICSLTGTVTVTNSTFADNAAPRGGGLQRNFGQFTLHNTLVVGNPVGNDCQGDFIADVFNIDSDGTCGDATVYSLQQIKLLPLANSGGPTLTMALDEGSAAIDHAPSSSCVAASGNDVDQRGYGRNADGDGVSSDNECDIGAYEYSANPDTTPPIITPNISGTQGSNGWYVSNVTVSWTVTDDESAVAAQSGCNAVTITSDTTGMTLTCTATSAGGTTSESVTIRRDATAPTLAPSVSPNPVLLNGTAAASANASDSTSGVAISSCGTVNTTSVGVKTLNCTATDRAGNTRTATVSYTVLDTTPPVITPNISGTLGSNGWYASNVTVSWNVTDDESTVTTQSGCDAVTITNDTTGTTLTCTATSLGGTASESVTIRRDATAPTLAPLVSPNPVLLNGVATASANASDATSGVATSSCGTVNTASVGIKTVSCTATDNAGNTRTTTAVYTVAFTFAGFFAPIDNPPVLNVAKAGQSIPLKWRLIDSGGKPVTNLASVTVTVASLACSLRTSADQLEEYAAGASGLQNLGNGYYQFNWKTPKSYANSCKTMILDLGEGIVHEALFQFTK